MSTNSSKSLKDIVLCGTRAELVEYNYNEMVKRTCQQTKLRQSQINPDITHIYKNMAELNADIVLAMRSEWERIKNSAH